MKLSRTATYAIHALIYIARHTPGQPVIGHEAAANLGIPEGFFLRILVALSRGKILASVKGPNGGYLLAREPSDMTLLDAIEAVEGPMRAEVAWVGSTPSRLNAKLRSVLDAATDEVRQQLQDVTIHDLMALRSKPMARRR